MKSFLSFMWGAVTCTGYFLGCNVDQHWLVLGVISTIIAFIMAFIWVYVNWDKLS